MVVESVHLHILPSMNPDGFSLKQRGNANNIDLNRDFPDQVLFCAVMFPFFYFFCQQFIFGSVKFLYHLLDMQGVKSKLKCIIVNN